ncbi:hypothetical protein ACNOYE_30195 [Nannocystaceae bacterium ST9]
MSDEPRHVEQAGHGPWGIASIALVAGLLQIVASVALGMAKLDAFAAAALERPFMYMVVAVLIAAGVGSVWMVRERPSVAFALALLWPAGLWYGLRGKLTGLGLAYHGEFILHHFSAVLSLVLAVMVPLAWAREPRLGRARWVPLVFALPGALALALAHAGKLPGAPTAWALPSLSIFGGALLLMAWPAAVGLFWTRMGPRERRPIAVILLLPVLVRLGFVGAPGLTGELVPQHAIPWLGSAIVLTSVAVLLLLRPRLERWVLVVVGVICLIGSMFFYYLYQHGFGELEDGLAGLLQSLFGFQVPYPSYVDSMRSAAFMMGLFFAFVTVYASLVSSEDRVRGIAFGLMVIAGLGFSSPHLVSMLGAGALLFVDTLLPGAPYRELGQAGLEGSLARLDGADRPDIDTRVQQSRSMLEKLVERIPGLEGPTVVEADDHVVLAVRGALQACPVDVRIRAGRAVNSIELTVGVIESGEPILQIVPDVSSRGQRPAHLLARSHRVVGDLRALEKLGDEPLDALSGFPSALAKVWQGGMRIDAALTRSEPSAVEALIRAMVRAMAAI